MIIVRPSAPPLRFVRRNRLTAALPLAAVVLFAAGTTLASAQASPILAAAPAPLLLSSTSAASLPDAPGMAGEAISSSLPGADAQSSATYTSGRGPSPMASHTDKYISPGQPVPSLSAKDKFALGVKDALSPLAFVGWVVTAGYEQALNGSPNYGTNSVAFGKRLGAAAGRATSEGIFSDSIMSPILHEDPRYYRMGPGHNFLRRAAYAATRTLVTRTDSGHTTPNFALLAGNLGGSYLTKTYYPDLNTTNTEVLTTFGGSIGGSALGFVVSEFLPGGLNIFHGSKPAQD